jgi:hypothetical protein
MPWVVLTSGVLCTEYETAVDRYSSQVTASYSHGLIKRLIDTVID